ncbi:hypothetical protein [Aureimonas jatrophae]|uniref:Uncharacterized protein n=1 Tax=Aureimonas jatrophae TaxID=1166073 RepID=A0A1H0HZ54_9HYPH|nr:hypothetical protein [Aureimonas jatrophae]MBB3950855.1 hypothetical protein [Aureimonas jatrophae]SDO24429.1 hypothetical protein SAMN05192530_104362 [Aureimonas jatrophae]
MIVLDDEHDGWVLLAEDGQVYLDVLYSHSAVDYLFLLRLRDDEVALWRERGPAYLDDLAYRIHASAPGVVGSRSVYKSRSLVLTPERERASEAIRSYRSTA